MRRVLLAVLAVVVLTVSGCTGLEGTGDKDYVVGDGRVVPIAPEDRDPPVESSGTTLTGDSLDVSDYRGQVLVVNVWGSWCPPCRKEMPALIDVAEDLPSGASMIGINSRESEANADAFVRTAGIPFPSLHDPGGTALLDFSEKLGPDSFPTTMVLDRQGRLARLILGPIPSERTLQQTVDDVLAEPDAPAGGAA